MCYLQPPAQIQNGVTKFRYRQIPTPPKFLEEAPSKKSQGKTKHGEGPINLIFLQEIASGLHICKKVLIWCIMFMTDIFFPLKIIELRAFHMDHIMKMGIVQFIECLVNLEIQSSMYRPSEVAHGGREIWY